MDDLTVRVREGIWLRAKMPYILFILACAIAAGLFFFRLNTYPMQNWDEGVHSQVTQEMVDTGDYWTLHYQGENYFRKPPLKMWMTAPLVSIFGNENWVYRFWSAVAGVASVGLFYWFIYKKEQSYVYALIAASIFMSGQFILYHSFRTGEMDSLLIFFIMLGLFGYWQSEKNKYWWLVVGIAFGLAIMAKSLAGVVGPMIVLADILIRRRFDVFRERLFWLGTILAAVVIVPWHISMIIEHGRAFIDEYIGFHIVDRTFTQLYADLPVYWYLKIAYERMFPIAFFFLGALFIFLRGILQEKRTKDIILLAWVFVPLLLYTWVKTKFEWYILPIYPALAWMIAGYFMYAVRNLKDWLVQATGAIGLFLVLGFLPSGVIPGAKTFWFTLQAYTPRVIVDFLQNGLVLSCVATILVVSLIVFLHKKKKKFAVIFVYCIIAYIVLFGFVRTGGTIVTLPSSSVYTAIASELQTREIQLAYIYESDFYDKPAAYFEVYRSGIEVTRADSLSDVRVGSAIISSVELVDSDYVLIGHIDQYYIYER